MITGVQFLPSRYSPGTELNSEQHRTIANSRTSLDVPVGTNLEVPDYKKVRVCERYGNVYIERYFLSTDTSKLPRYLTPIYMKVYEGEHASVLLFVRGIQRALNRIKNDQSLVYPLKMALLEMIHDEVLEDNDAISTTIDDYLKSHGELPLVNDEISGFSEMGDPLSAGYPWDIANLTSNNILVEFRKNTTDLPGRTIQGLRDLALTINLWNNVSCSPLVQALEDTFDPYCCPTLERNGLDQLSFKSIYEDIPLQDIRKQPREHIPRIPDFTLDDKIQPTLITEYSTEILKFCVWIHQSLFNEVMFRTILPNRNTPISVRLIQAFTYAPQGVDLSLFQLELASLLQTWDTDRYRELIVTKTASDELFLELIGRDAKDNQLLYIDLFYTTLMSQALIRSNIDVTK